MPSPSFVSKQPYFSALLGFTPSSKAARGRCSSPSCHQKAVWAVLFHVERPGITVNRHEARCPTHGDSL